MPSPLDDEHTESALEEVLRVLDRLPFVSGVKRDVNSLRELLYFRRAPRLAVVGDRQADRLGLVGTLLGRDSLPQDVGGGSWVRVHAQGALVDLLDVPLDDPQAVERLDRALAEALPDVVLLTFAAPDVDDAMARSLAGAGPLLGKLGEAEHRFAVLTRIEELPAANEDPPYSEDKEQMVSLTTQRLERGLREAGVEVEAVRAVSGRDGTGVDELSNELVPAFPERARLEGARGLIRAAKARREVANRVVHSASTLALTVGMAPIPFSDAFVIAPLQVAMVSAVAHLGGRPWDRRAISEWVASMGVVGSAGMGLRWTARQLLKLVPGAGTLVSAGVAGAGTVTMGQSAIAYFLRDDARRLSAGSRAA